MKTRDWAPPTIDKSLTPDRWGVVDRIIAGMGILSFLTLIVGCAVHLV